MEIKLISKRAQTEGIYWRMFFSQIIDVRLVGLFNMILIHLGSDLYHKFVCALKLRLENGSVS